MTDLHEDIAIRNFARSHLVLGVERGDVRHQSFMI